MLISGHANSVVFLLRSELDFCWIDFGRVIDSCDPDYLPVYFLTL